MSRHTSRRLTTNIVYGTTRLQWKQKNEWKQTGRVFIVDEPRFVSLDQGSTIRWQFAMESLSNLVPIG